MSTEKDVPANPFSDTYVELASLLPETAETAVVDDANAEPYSDLAKVTENLQKSVLTEPATVPVPALRSPSLVTNDPRLSQPSLNNTSISPVGLDTPITWRKCDLMYLLSLLKSEELVANTLVFTPSLDDLEHATYPIHLQLHRKTTPIPPGFELDASSFDAHIVTSSLPSQILVAESATNCRTAAIARRSLAHFLVSNPAVVSDVIDRYNVLYTLYTTSLPQLQSIYRAMCIMTAISDREWFERLAQLRGFVNAQYLVGRGVDATCPVEARVEYYLLEMGRAMLEGWIRMARVCLDLSGEKERAACAEVYKDAACFLARASDEVMD